MYNHKTRILIVLWVLAISVSSNAQIHIFDNLKVDSLGFTNSRNEINNLPNTLFEKHVFRQANKELPYRLLLPKNYNKKQKYPVIVTLHNSSRIGSDNEKQLEHLSKIWIRPEIYRKYNVVVIAPQFNTRSSIYAENQSGILSSKSFDDIHLVVELINQIEKEHNIDKSKIYLVGYSMGASTAQNLINLYPEKFAAIVSIAAVPDFSNLKAWKHKNIYLIHGKNDVDNPYKGSEELFSRLKHNKNVIFKTYNNLDHHNITIPFLLSDEIPNWLFKEQK
ncbi:alpha/beta fold hydrolase [Arcticibacter tournemirensis]|uniref:Alpha/beta fold hydrolase n=1 Tax=Arcticibacter tournemirensis TaxID=699437 RepID=A0A4Q0M4B4_9SPHI|nr:alpha/beta fold hydrolase [Arcticibacter tournemirensis]RXF67663.1 alpha/beta fold hydrolase [Arcticibacter tournemirensis]